MPTLRSGEKEYSLCQGIVCVGLTLLLFAPWLAPATPAFATDANAPERLEFFDPNGYYFPTAGDLVAAGHKIDWVELHAVEYYYEGSLHDEKPRFVQPAARLAVTRLADQKKFAYDCPRPVITREAVTVSCPSTPMGVVSLHGTFVDLRGQFWNRSEIVPQETVVLVATVSIADGANARLSRRVSFTYWGGD